MSIMRNINFIKELSRIPCAQPDIWIILETAFKSAPPAMLTLFLPGCTDIVKMRIGSSPWHARSIRGLIKGAIKPFPISERKFLYKIGYFTAEKYLWWWMVADVTTEFITTWQSMVYQEQQCELPGAGTAYGRFAPEIYIPEQEATLIVGSDQTRPCCNVETFGIVIYPGCQGSVAYSIEWDSWPVRGQGVSVDTWMTVEGGPDVTNFMSTNDPLLNNGSFTQGHLFHNKPGVLLPTIYRVHMRNNGINYAQAINGRWNVGLQGRREGGITWGCKPKPVEWPFPNPFA